MSKPITENIIEESAIELLQSQGWDYANGKEILLNLKTENHYKALRMRANSA